ncbi:MAG TPA: rhomboid family intramembrane serine protease [Candidatus Methylomirabilis sp.]
MFIIPIAHEDQKVRRLPWVTIGLIALNLAAFLAVLPAVNRQAAEIRARSREVVGFVQEHPYLRLPEELEGRLPTESPPANLPAEVLAEQQARLDRLVGEIREMTSGSVYRTFGYVPARPSLLPLFTSMFMHGGWLHLLGNMLFLWLAAPSLEDRWGRGLFLVFYLISGIAGTAIHVALNPQSTTPLIGASGAIAGLMGAFLVRVGSTRIRFFYWIFLLRIFAGTFYARAYVVLPFWLLQQVAMAMGGRETGVAVWAHIGGFGFGAAVALLIRATGLEASVLAPAIDKKTTWTPADRLGVALGRLERGDAGGAIRDMQALVRARPEDLDTRMALVSAYAARGDRAAAGRESALIVVQQVKARDMDGALAAFREHAAAHHDVPLPTREQLALAAHCEQIREYQEAADLYRGALAGPLDDPLVPKALLAFGKLKLQVFKRADDAMDLLERAAAHPQAAPEIQRAAAEGLAAARQALRPPWAAAASPPAPAPVAIRADPPREAPPPSAPIPAGEAGSISPVPGGRRLVPLPVRAVGIDARGLHLQDRGGKTGVLEWGRVAAVSVGRIGDPEAADPVPDPLILDLLMAPRSTPAGAEFRCARLALQDLAIPQLQGEPSPVRAFQRLVATVLKASGAAAHPSREACLTLQGLAVFPNLEEYEADVVARLSAGG